MNSGRFQAQGTMSGRGKGAKLEESQAWDQASDYNFCCGIRDIRRLKGKLNKSQLKLREDAFAKAEDEVIRCSKHGGVMASDYAPKSFVVRGTRSERVDIEVRRGVAFLPNKCGAKV
ncbi:hypothetical protein G6Z92_19660 [Vibrio aestuarianus subsp. cardii]|uniref:hypothetical protein n=1 Tax=Vibrio aestuarianus TaxID=28171 RepID=UPI0015C55007|nr:hypothetical protein [Vibrio aestuarianus]NGZ69117.1 hypothetical protein [Vibrio aestuarianus subsp. cardii]